MVFAIVLAAGDLDLLVPNDCALFHLYLMDFPSLIPLRLARARATRAKEQSTAGRVYFDQRAFSCPPAQRAVCPVLAPPVRGLFITDDPQGYL